MGADSRLGYINDIPFNGEIKESATENKSNGIKTFLSKIADNLIYSFFTVDSKYGACGFVKSEGNTAITYKDLENKINDMNSKESIIEESNIGEVIKGTTDIWSETAEFYAYIDSEGKINTNHDYLKEVSITLNRSNKFIKIIGDGVKFYLLTEDGQVYFVTSDSQNDYYEFIGDLLQNEENLSYVTRGVFKLPLKNIVDIYDSSTALNSDGEIVSLIDFSGETSVVQELQKQCDEYLIGSHIGLIDGKIYDFTNVQEGKEVQAGNFVKLKAEDSFPSDQILRAYSEKDKKIYVLRDILMSDITQKFIEESNENGIYPVITCASNETVPEFIDIVEKRNGLLTDLYALENIDRKQTAYAITATGDIWTYVDGYLINTGMNLDYYGPTTNYEISNVKWTNNDIDIEVTNNTTNEIETVKITENNNENEEITNKIEKNGTYKIRVQDTKKRMNTTMVEVRNIDKLKPNTPQLTIENNVIKGIVAKDAEETEEYAESGINRIEISYDEKQWTIYEGEIPIDTALQNSTNARAISSGQDEHIVYAKSVDNAGNESDIVELLIPNEEQDKEQDEENDNNNSGENDKENNNGENSPENNNSESNPKKENTLPSGILPFAGRMLNFSYLILGLLIIILIVIIRKYKKAEK